MWIVATTTTTGLCVNCRHPRLEAVQLLIIRNFTIQWWTEEGLLFAKKHTVREPVGSPIWDGEPETFKTYRWLQLSLIFPIDPLNICPTVDYCWETPWTINHHKPWIYTLIMVYHGLSYHIPIRYPWNISFITPCLTPPRWVSPRLAAGDSLAATKHRDLRRSDQGL